MPQDYADKLAHAMGEGLDSFTAGLYARNSRRLRAYLPTRHPVDPDEEDDEDDDDIHDDDSDPDVMEEDEDEDRNEENVTPPARIRSPVTSRYSISNQNHPTGETQPSQSRHESRNAELETRPGPPKPGEGGNPQPETRN